MPWNPPEPGFGFLPPDQALEERGLPEGRALLRKSAKREFKKAGRLKNVAEIVAAIPPPGSSLHVIGNGAYDFFDWIPHLQALMGEPARGWFSTWTMNRGNVLDLLGLYDAGRLTSLTMLTGLYFKRRESSVYATLLEGIQERGQRYLAFLNHTKLILLQAGEAYITVEGSANLTSNPRLEQYVISNDQSLLEFHTEWIEALPWRQ